MAKERSSLALKIGIIVIAVVFVVILFFGAALQWLSNTNDWRSFTLNYNNSRYQYNTTLNAQNIGDIHPVWNITTNSFITSTPIVDKGNVYFDDWNGLVYSASLSSGKINWVTNLGHAISTTPTVYDGELYVGFGLNGPTRVVALSEEDGSVIWNTTLNSTDSGIWGSPTIYNGILYIGTAAGAGGPGGLGGSQYNLSLKGQLFAINAFTGKVIWIFNATSNQTSGAGVWSSVVVDPTLDAIYFGTGNAFSNNTNALHPYSIVSLNATTGKPNWFYRIYSSNALGDDYDFGETPNLFTIQLNGTTYQAVGDGSKNGNYYIVDRSNGTLLEKFNIGTAGGAGGIVGLSSFIYNSSPSDPEIFVPSYYSNGTSCCGVVEAIEPSKNSVDWRFVTGGDMRGSVSSIPGAVLFGDDNGTFYALSAKNGSVLYTTKLPNAIDAGITVAEGYVLVPAGSSGPGSTRGLYAFN